MAKVTAAQLDEYVGKNIQDICTLDPPADFPSDCAHFVSHVLGLRIGLLCDQRMASSPKSQADAVSVRVDDIYNYGLTSRGKWADRPQIDNGDGLLVFVTKPIAFSSGTDSDMANIPAKHIGILCGGKVYHYSNGRGKVRGDQSPEEFLTDFQHTSSYGKTAQLYFGVVQ